MDGLACRVFQPASNRAHGPGPTLPRRAGAVARMGRASSGHNSSVAPRTWWQQRRLDHKMRRVDRRYLAPKPRSWNGLLWLAVAAAVALGVLQLLR